MKTLSLFVADVDFLSCKMHLWALTRSKLSRVDLRTVETLNARDLHLHARRLYRQPSLLYAGLSCQPLDHLCCAVCCSYFVNGHYDHRMIQFSGWGSGLHGASQKNSMQTSSYVWRTELQQWSSPVAACSWSAQQTVVTSGHRFYYNFVLLPTPRLAGVLFSPSFACLFVSMITHIVMRGFSWNLGIAYTMDQRRVYKLSVRVMVRG